MFSFDVEVFTNKIAFLNINNDPTEKPTRVLSRIQMASQKRKKSSIWLIANLD